MAPTGPRASTDEAPRVQQARAKVGSTLREKWHLNALIAVGGMGAVYDGTHRNGMRGAVKILDPLLGQSAACRKRFLREGRLANRVHHHGAVQVIDDDEAEDGTAYLVMELLEGSTLEDLAIRSGGKLEPATVIEHGLQVLDTLSEASASGIVHRDIKPENLFLTTERVVKILDFGIAGLVIKEGSLTETLAGEAIGTPAFMAPEQARGRWELVDHQSDLYSLGASLFTLMTGNLVHGSAGTVAEMLVQAITMDPPSLREAMPDAPEALVAAIDGALKLKKAERWLDAAAMRVALEEAYVALTGKPAPAPRAYAPGSLTPVTVSPGRLSPLTRTTMALRRVPRVGWLAGSAALIAVAGMAAAMVAIAPHGAAVAATAAMEPITRTPRPAVVTLPLLTSAPASSAAPALPATSTVGTHAGPSAAVRSRRYDALYDRRR